ncbi:MAG TPA: exodeoxyribonuclease III [Hyphomicrobiales bacterium]|nr:exodeoxyribonuclease III [Hyphomicrobiales bacterium]
MLLLSWNVNGLRAVMKKDFLPSMLAVNPDVICLQETKAQDDQVREALTELSGYHVYTNSAQKKGYSGTAILSRHEPLDVRNDMGMEEHDQEGRVIAAEFPSYYLVTVYTPNSGSELKRLGYRQAWDRDFLQYLKQLEKRKPVVVCGDLNVANTEIDLARPRENYNKAAGYMQEEIDGINRLLGADLVDTYRHLFPEQKKYSWWSYRAAARERDVGWRIDYFLVSRALLDKVERADILNHVFGSDHCPVLLKMRAP